MNKIRLAETTILVLAEDFKLGQWSKKNLGKAVSQGLSISKAHKKCWIALNWLKYTEVGKSNWVGSQTLYYWEKTSQLIIKKSEKQFRKDQRNQELLSIRSMQTAMSKNIS